ncbi:MAG: N-acetylmuramidase family protein [Pseudohongiella sp.]|uniref:N-acetylmuramidase domain-containing protein n=1 Tax=Pseudohongiella sp. TaxID=1979412 RepID=UPI00349FEF1B
MIRIGDVGQNVAALQQGLKSAGADIEVDGWFGEETEKAVIRFQRNQGLMVDGVAGPATLGRLNPNGTPTTGKELCEKDLKAAAKKLGVQLAAIKAVTEVESKETGFLPSGRPVILFERHVMFRRLDTSTRTRNAAKFPAIVNEKPGGYVGGDGEWRRLKRASVIDLSTAIESASWGLFQIMGFHWQGLGYASADEYSEAMHRNEGEHLEAFVRFIKQDKALHAALKDRDWPTFAARYNGPAYTRNQYDTRMATAYDRYRLLGRCS